MKSKMSVYMLVGTLVELAVMVPFCMHARDATGPIVAGVGLWFAILIGGVALFAPRGGGTSAARTGNGQLPEIMVRQNYYNTQVMRQDLDQIARTQQNIANKNGL